MATSEDVKFLYEEGELWWKLVFVFVFLLLFVFAFVLLRRPLSEEVVVEDGETMAPSFPFFVFVFGFVFVSVFVLCLCLYFCTMTTCVWG